MGKSIEHLEGSLLRFIDDLYPVHDSITSNWNE